MYAFALLHAAAKASLADVDQRLLVEAGFARCIIPDAALARRGEEPQSGLLWTRVEILGH
jgi:hypothetical protein